MEQMPKLDEETFQAWLAHPGTQALKWVLEEWKREVEEKLAAGYFIDFPIHAARISGSHQICQRILTMNFDFIMSEVLHAEQERAEAIRASGAGEAVHAGAEEEFD